MSGLRILALSYLASASVFVMAATIAAHPGIGRDVAAGSRALSSLFSRRVWQPAMDKVRQQDVAFLDTLDRRVRIDMTPPPAPEPAHSSIPSPRTVASNDIVPPEFAASASVTILPDLSPDMSSPDISSDVTPKPEALRPPEPRMLSPKTPRAVMPDIQVASAAPPVIAAPPPLRASVPPSARAAAVAARLRISLTQEMLQSFDLFLYVSKADHGPLAQRMYVFQKQPGDVLKLAYDWPASTGREKQEVNPRGDATFTATPRGYYELDPNRMYRRYRSYSWDQPMPNAMFFNWERQGLQTGLAIHAASGDDIARLGQRASAGCVHLSPENAQALYEMIHKDYRGQVPRFAYNGHTQTMSNDGTFMHDTAGHLKMQGGYKVLTFIEDFGGGNEVAALF